MAGARTSVGGGQERLGHGRVIGVPPRKGRPVEGDKL